VSAEMKGRRCLRSNMYLHSTEQITGLDLVAIQLQIASKSSLRQIGLGRHHSPLPFPLQTSIQVRVNAEQLQQDGNVLPTGGTLLSFHAPSGPGIRIDTAIHAPLHKGHLKYQHDPSFDSLLAKVIFTAPTYQSAIQLASQRLKELELHGIQSNVFLLRALLETSQVQKNQDVHTRFLEENVEQLYTRSQEMMQSENTSDGFDTAESISDERQKKQELPQGTLAIDAPMAGIIAQVLVNEGDEIQAGQQVALVESMKMEHVIRASQSGKIEKVFASKGASVTAGDHIISLRPNNASAEDVEANAIQGKEEDVNVIRDDLASVTDRKHLLTDDYRKKAVEKRHAAGFLTARENIDLLIDKGSFSEIGDFVMAAQRTRIDEIKLMETTSGDGVITGWATINKDRHGDTVSSHLSSPARCALVIYDYMVLAGTQGHFHHLKLDRIFRSVLENPAPVILYAEGGGGRPGDVDLVNVKVAGLDGPAFALLALIRSRGIPTIGLANGYTFAGNAILLGTCDIIIATRGGRKDAGEEAAATSTGVGGPAMIEGGGLGVFKPAEVGPVSVHESNGGYDIVVADEEEASQLIKRILSLFQGPVGSNLWKYNKDSMILRRLLPINRVRSYNVNTVIEHIVDDDSFIEMGRLFGQSLVTGLATLHGQPIAILASNVTSPLGGAIDGASAIKATRFINMLHRTKVAHLMVLCDTPGFMVGPAAEKEGGLRAFGEFFQSVVQFQDGTHGGRVFAVTLRKAYGLGAQAMLGGSTLNNFQSAAWPMAEFAGMGIEGAVRLGMKKELEAVEDEQERKELYQSFVDVMYQRGKAENMAAMAEIDTVIDPKDTRSWLINGLRSVHPRIPTWKQKDDRSKL
jgi:acetyl-CoA carboxylase carboxyltransferase component/biotin carboxyl carrier protein